MAQQLVVVPEGFHPLFLSSYSPELQPAERLWELADEPLANRSFNTLDDLEAVLMQRCRVMLKMENDIRARTNFHWWAASSLKGVHQPDSVSLNLSMRSTEA